MAFSSLEFLFFFFPVVFLINYILPKKVRNYWLLSASLFFYAWAETTFFLLLVCSILLNFLSGLLLERLNYQETSENLSDNTGISNKKTFRKILFIASLLINFGVLIISKYSNFITSIIRSSIPVSQGFIPQTSFLLPAAISFFTFQSVSYIIDVFRGTPAEKNLCSYALFITFFPKLLQGPIIRYNDFSPQLKNRKTTFKDFSDGVIRFLTGFNQKILLADILSEVTDTAFNARTISVGMAWLGMLAYSLQLYFDFSGYSDMAIGLGKMFGFQIKENFNFPYISKSVSEFWRRWHISLGTWFRDYLYFPLGGSHVSSKFRISLNLMIVWITTGIWHGANGTFIIWGVLHGILVVFEKITNITQRLNNKYKRFLYRLFVLISIMFGWMIFRSDNLSSALFYTKSLFKLNNNPWVDDLFIFNSREYIITLIMAIIAAFPVIRKLRKHIESSSVQLSQIIHFVWYIIQILLAAVSVSSLIMNNHNPFLYSNF